MDRAHRYHAGLPQPTIKTRIARWLLRRSMKEIPRPSLEEQIEFLWLCAVQAHQEAEDYKEFPQHAETVKHWQRKAAMFRAAGESLQKLPRR
jgi:hypothetical protein